ncbi:hypothetical protein M3I53_35975, partial [Paraburkholderia sp. CNPSo 3272]|uniref:hypothetical protein n=1 Tax=Paraburkholderia sp. CNPSo 3272 TaxID=2940931 RepID=UPI0020B803B6
STANQNRAFRFGSPNTHFGGVNSRFGGLNTDFGKMNTRFGAPNTDSGIPRNRSTSNETAVHLPPETLFDFNRNPCSTSPKYALCQSQVKRFMPQ